MRLSLSSVACFENYTPRARRTLLVVREGNNNGKHFLCYNLALVIAPSRLVRSSFPADRGCVPVRYCVADIIAKGGMGLVTYPLTYLASRSDTACQASSPTVVWVSWGTYPAIYLFPMLDPYCVADIIAKCGMGLVTYPFTYWAPLSDMAVVYGWILGCRL